MAAILRSSAGRSMCSLHVWRPVVLRLSSTSDKEVSLQKTRKEGVVEHVTPDELVSDITIPHFSKRNMRLTFL